MKLYWFEFSINVFFFVRKPYAHQQITVLLIPYEMSKNDMRHILSE